MITYNFSCDGGPGLEDFCNNSILNVEMKDVSDWKIDRRSGVALCPAHKPSDSWPCATCGGDGHNTLQHGTGFSAEQHEWANQPTEQES